MKNQRKFWIGALCGALVSFCVVGAVFGVNHMSDRSSDDSSVQETAEEELSPEEKMDDIDGLIQLYYLYGDDIDDEDLLDGVYAGYVSALPDPYSAYYSVEETDEMFQDNAGTFYGIGATVVMDEDTSSLKILSVNEGGPAEQAGLLPEDLVYQVDDHETAGEDSDTVVGWLKGEEGSEVTLQVIRGDEHLEITVTRGEVQEITVSSSMQEDGIGYLYIKEFDTVTYDQFAAALDDLEEQGMEGLIVDLRYNLGGNLSTVTDMLQLILPEGPIVSTRDSNGKEEVISCDGKHEFTKPLVVLVNQYTASASEIFAGAVQDYGIGTIVGTTTYGKGVVQNIYKLPDGSSLKLTASEYFTPNGENIDGKGITPDVEVDYVADETGEGKDNQLETAMQVIRDQR